MMTRKILITGASGLIGTQLTSLLLQEGNEVVHVGRTQKSSSVPTYVWNPQANEIDPAAFKNVKTIVHLAGAGVADKRWTAKRKKEILDSRVHSTRLLLNALRNTDHSVDTIVSASAIGFYGFDGDEKIFTENDAAGKDFLAHVTQQWEHEVDQFQSVNIRVVKIRIGIVLSEKGGALKEMAKPIRFGVGAPLGSGNQYLSWIHINDLCRLFMQAINDQKMHGAYNGATAWCTNAELTKAIAKNLHRPLWLPAVPAFLLKNIVGEMADMLLHGNKVSSKKIRETGFVFQYQQMEDAVRDLLDRN